VFVDKTGTGAAEPQILFDEHGSEIDQNEKVRS